VHTSGCQPSNICTELPKRLFICVAPLPGRWNKDGNGSPNYEMDERTFLLNRERAVDYLNMLDRLYVFDGYAGWDPEVQLARLSVVTPFWTAGCWRQWKQCCMVDPGRPVVDGPGQDR
jgi:hypothetical protein